MTHSTVTSVGFFVGKNNQKLPCVILGVHGERWGELQKLLDSGMELLYHPVVMLCVNKGQQSVPHIENCVVCFFKKKGTHTVFLYDGEKGYRQVVPELPMGESVCAAGKPFYTSRCVFTCGLKHFTGIFYPLPFISA